MYCSYQALEEENARLRQEIISISAELMGLKLQLLQQAAATNVQPPESNVIS